MAATTAGLGLGTRSDNSTSCFLPTLELAKCTSTSSGAAAGAGEEAARAPAPGRHVTLVWCWRSVAMSRCPALHITAAVSRVTCHDMTAGLSLAVFTVLTRELGMGK